MFRLWKRASLAFLTFVTMSILMACDGTENVTRPGEGEVVPSVSVHTVDRDKDDARFYFRADVQVDGDLPIGIKCHQDGEDVLTFAIIYDGETASDEFSFDDLEITRVEIQKDSLRFNFPTPWITLDNGEVGGEFDFRNREYSIEDGLSSVKR